MTGRPHELDARGASANPDPIRIDGVTLARDVDFTALARDILTGRAGDAGPNAIWPLDWLWRNYPRLIGTAYAAPLSRGVTGCLDDEDPAILSQAFAFFQEHSTAAGAEHVEDVVERRREQLRGV